MPGRVVHAVSQKSRMNGAPGYVGAAYWIPALWVPALLVTHNVVFVVLLRRWTRTA